MTDAAITLKETGRTRTWIRLRTLVLLRWWAIAGQLTALFVAQQGLNLSLETGLCYMAVGASGITNVIATFVFPENKRLSERETLLIVLFDMLQLGLLLYLTGGLHNPFSILVIAPVTISASVLSIRSTVLLAIVTIFLVTLLVGTANAAARTFSESSLRDIISDLNKLRSLR